MNPAKDIALSMAAQEAARRARAQYMREWRAKNKDREKASRERYWNRVAAKNAAAQKDN